MVWQNVGMAGLVQYLGDKPLLFHLSNPRAQQSCTPYACCCALPCLAL